MHVSVLYICIQLYMYQWIIRSENLTVYHCGSWFGSLCKAVVSVFEAGAWSLRGRQPGAHQNWLESVSFSWPATLMKQMLSWNETHVWPRNQSSWRRVQGNIDQKQVQMRQTKTWQWMWGTKELTPTFWAWKPMAAPLPSPLPAKTCPQISLVSYLK